MKTKAHNSVSWQVIGGHIVEIELPLIPFVLEIKNRFNIPFPILVYLLVKFFNENNKSRYAFDSVQPQHKI